MNHYHYIFTGTGLSALLTLFEMIQSGQFSDKKMLLMNLQNNDGDTVTLKNSEGTIVATLSYGSEGGDNQSLGRDPDFTGSFVKHSAITGNGGALFSPGYRNDGSTLSVVKNQIENFVMYPNPVSNGMLYMSSSSNLNKQVTIYAMNGQQVYSNSLQLEEKMNISNLTRGIYFVRIQEDGKISTRKLIVN